MSAAEGAIVPARPSGVFAGLQRPAFWRGLALPALILLVWTLATHLKLVNPHLLVKPERVISRAVQEVREGELFAQLGASLQRDLLGVLLGSVVGVIVGGLMGLSRTYDRLFGPTFHAAKQVAIFAWIPLMSVWLGTGEVAKVVFIALAAFYPVVINTHQGVRGTQREYLEVARAYRFSRAQVLRKVVLPSALPSLFAGLHLALIYGWLGTIGAEYLLAPAPGIGNLMISGRESFAMDKVLLGVIIVGAVGALLNTLVTRLETRLLKWRVPSFESRSEGT